MKTNLYFQQTGIKRIAKISWFIGLILLAVIPYIYSIIFSPVSIDAGYYLSIVERIRDGFVPYYDLHLSYTPFFFYLTAAIKSILSIGICYSFDLAYLFTFQLSTGLIVYKISLIFTERKNVSYYAAIFYLIISYWLTQYEFILETPSCFFGLLALYLLLTNNKKTSLFLLFGIISALSFLVKQYGLGFFILSVYTLLSRRYNKIQLLLYIIGYTVPIIALICIEPKVQTILFGNGYGLSSIQDSYSMFIKKALMQIFWAASYLLYRIPVIVMAIILLRKIQAEKKNEAYLILLGIVGFMLQFIFAPFNHYYLYITPFVSLFLFYILSCIPKEKIISKLYAYLIVIAFIIGIIKVYQRIIQANRNVKAEECKEAKKIKGMIKFGENLYIADSRIISYYYLSNICPPNLNYSFGTGLTEKKHFQQLKDADNILDYKSPIVYDKFLYTPRVLDYINKISMRDTIKTTTLFNKDLNKQITEETILYKKE